MSGTASKTSSNWVLKPAHLARVGSLARATLYLVVGFLALLVALNNPHGSETDTFGVLRQLLQEQLLGRVAVLLIAVGLICYSVWRVILAVRDFDHYGRSWSGLQMRIGYFASGVGYGGLGIYALLLATGILAVAENRQMSERALARWLLGQPFGRAVLILTGLVILIVAFVQLVRAFSASFMRDLQFPSRHRVWMMMVCSFGLLARATTFAILGVFFINAGWKARSREVGGLHKAWETLRAQPYGNFVLGLVAVGFIAFGVFGLTEGFFRLRDPSRIGRRRGQGRG